MNILEKLNHYGDKLPMDFKQELKDLWEENQRLKELTSVQKNVTNGIGHAEQIIQNIEMLRNRDGYDEELLDTDLQILIGILKGEIKERAGLKEQFIIVSDDGYWINDFGWGFSYSDASRFDDAGGNLPIAENVRWERVFDYDDKASVNRLIEKLNNELIDIQSNDTIDRHDSERMESIEKRLAILSSAKESVWAIPTPKGLITVIPSTDPGYPGVYVGINGEQAALVEYLAEDKFHKVHVWLEKDHSDDSHATYLWEENAAAVTQND